MSEAIMEKIYVNDKEFKVIKLLGKGKGGYSYLVSDEKKCFVVKQIHHEPCEYYTFGNKLESEMNDYQTLCDIGIRIPVMFETDIKNERILKEFIDGPTIYELVLRDKVKPCYIEQVNEMCTVLYPHQLNIDYFPTNFIVHNDLIWYIDYECNTYVDKWNFENWGIKYWSKTPELMEYNKAHNS